MRQLTIGNKTFTNRFFLGTGKFASSEQARAALAASETELVTVALTRVHEGDSSGDDILKAIDRNKVEVMLNTSGARNADEAVRIAIFTRSSKGVSVTREGEESCAAVSRSPPQVPRSWKPSAYASLASKRGMQLGFPLHMA